MHLKSLEIHGFKSFAERTLLEFHKGVTGIVGPNGCGKSNVVDAVRWVLGETSAKALRGGEMADVIFNGTEKRKPLGMAEVTMTLADCEEALNVEFNEISITRRVFRDGKGEYRINGTLCRLRDIHDLFADTGIGRSSYSIMAQGQIDQILSSKPEERRAVFEEAAGITKFKREKKEALRKLEYTEANLLRVGDVLAEQERRMNSLKRQVSKARRYQALSADVRVLDTHLAHRGYLERSAQTGELRTSIRSFSTRHDELVEQVPELEREVVGARHKAQALESELGGLRQRINEYRNALSTAEGRIAFNEERKNELESRIGQNRADIGTTREKLKQQEVDFEQANYALEELKRRISSQEEQLAAQEEKTAVARRRRDGLEQSLREGRGEMNGIQTRIASVQAKIENAVAQVEGTRERSRQLAEDEERMRQEIEVARAERDRLAAEIAEISLGIQDLEEAYEGSQRAYQRARAELETANAAAAEAHKTLATRSSRLEVVRNVIKRGDGLAKGTREVLGGLGDPDRFSKGVHGPLAGLIEVDNECARAVETALGAHLQAVLVEDGEFAAEVFSVLGERKSGEAELLPADYVGAASDRQLLTVPEGAVAWAMDRVKADKRVLPVVERLLENVLIVPDLATAMRMRSEHAGVSFATAAGEWLGAEGIVRAGASGQGGLSLLELRNEVRSLAKEVAGLETADAEARRRAEELARKSAELEEGVAAARDRLERRRVELSTREGESGLAERELEGMEAKLENVRWERGELETREQAAGESRKTLEEELAAARRRMEELEDAQARVQQEIEVAAREELELSEALQELRTSVAVERRARQAAEEQQLPMESRLQELRELTARREVEIETFEKRIAEAIEENERLVRECETKRADAAKIEAELEARSAGRGALEEAIDTRAAALDKVRREIAEIVERKGREEVALTKIELKLENMIETIRERYQVELETFEPDAHQLLACIENQKKADARRSARAASREAMEAAGPSAERSEDAGPGDAETADASPDETSAPAGLPGDVEGEPDWKFVKRIVVELRRRLESMGPVNVDAIEEFEELEERHNFVRSQHDDLVKSKSELMEVIERINIETERRFTETFEGVRKNFRAMFKVLFGEKGKADLVLVDENDPLESGIDVIAKPPGKKLQSITLLSGGERSMTAVALLFSIYMIKPSPFCVLDELDAPLDEANIGRFLKVLDGFIDHSQFIIVTHSKRTMERADVIYGVTMQEFGISKLVSMRLTQAEEIAHAAPPAKP